MIMFKPTLFGEIKMKIDFPIIQAIHYYTVRITYVKFDLWK